MSNINCFIISNSHFSAVASKYSHILSSKEKSVSLPKKVSRILVRNALSQFADIEPDKWTFTKTEKGKPYQTNIPQLFFSISYTKKILAVIVTDFSDIGIDAEYTRQDFVLDDLSPIISKQEITFCTKFDKSKALFFWTLNEAFLKVNTFGLSDYGKLPSYNREIDSVEDAVLRFDRAISFTDSLGENYFGCVLSDNNNDKIPNMNFFVSDSFLLPNSIISKKIKLARSRVDSYNNYCDS